MHVLLFWIELLSRPITKYYRKQDFFSACLWTFYAANIMKGWSLSSEAKTMKTLVCIIMIMELILHFISFLIESTCCSNFFENKAIQGPVTRLTCVKSKILCYNRLELKSWNNIRSCHISFSLKELEKNGFRFRVWKARRHACITWFRSQLTYYLNATNSFIFMIFFFVSDIRAHNRSCCKSWSFLAANWRSEDSEVDMYHDDHNTTFAPFFNRAIFIRRLCQKRTSWIWL